MNNNKYSLNIISRHSDFNGKNLKKYNLEGIDTVGAYGDEPFEIIFKNNTYEKIQVKISIDGTDILTGKLADTLVNDDMWTVNGYGTLNISAWPETNNGGSQLVFTSADKSVAIHTHGDLSNRGIIAAAVFIESNATQYITPFKYYWIGPAIINTPYINLYDYRITCNSTVGLSQQPNTYGTANICCDNTQSAASNFIENNNTNLVSVGAGDYVNQKITNVPGLIKPLFSETVRVRYLWWSDLEQKLKNNNYCQSHPTGFPGDKPIMNIGNTPKISTKKASKIQNIEYCRF